MSGLRLCARVWRLDDDAVVDASPTDVVPLASVGKVLVLAEVARRVDEGSLSLETLIPLHSEDRKLGGTGLLARLRPDRWTVQDLAQAVASVSDNAATNALIRTVSLEAISSLADEAGMVSTGVHDLIRASRGPDVPARFASGTPAELVRLLGDVAADRLISPGVCALLRDWMRLNTDRSLVADGVEHDPYAEGAPRVMNKTGTDQGVRADVGIVSGPRLVVYAVVGLTRPGEERRAVSELRRWGTVVEDLASAPMAAASPGHRSSTS